MSHSNDPTQVEGKATQEEDASLQNRSQTVAPPPLAEETMLKTVVSLAWPVIVEMLLLTLVGIVDMAMVGRLGAESIAAVGLGNQVVMLATTAFAAIRTGTTALIARHVGAREPEQAALIARQSIVMTLILAGSIFFVFSFFPVAGLRLLGAEPVVVTLGTGYMRWRAIGILFSLVTMVITGVLRGSGDTKKPMYVNIVVNIINPILNYIFIFGNFGAPRLGVTGAGLATTLAQVVGAILISRAIFSGNNIVKISLKDSYRLSWAPIKRILNIGIPAMVEAVLMRFAQVFFTIILTSLGTTTYAAHQIAIRAESLSFMPGWGFAVAATTLVGQNLGAERPDLAEKSGYMARNIALVVSSSMGVVFFLFPVQVVRIFTNDIEVIAQAAIVLRLIAIAQPAMAINMVIAGGLRGAGDTRWVTFITAVSVWLVRLTIAYVAVYYFHLGLLGAWFGMFADIFVRAILFSIRFARGKWKFLRI